MSGKNNKKALRKPSSKTKITGNTLVPLASKPKQVTSRRVSIRTSDERVAHIRGEDLLTEVSTTIAVTEAGQIVHKYLINPEALGTTRLRAFGRLYSKFRFKSLRIIYSPTAPQTTSGQLIGYIDHDPENFSTISSLTNLERFQQAGSQYKVQTIKVADLMSKGASWDIKGVDTRSDLYTQFKSGDDPRFYAQGCFVLLSGSAIPEHTPCGFLRMEYDIEFRVPHIMADSFNGHFFFGHSLPGGSLVDLFPSPIVASTNNLPIKFGSRNSNCLHFARAGTYDISFTLLFPSTEGVNGDKIVLLNPVSPSSGYRWQIAQETYNNSSLAKYSVSRFIVTIDRADTVVFFSYKLTELVALQGGNIQIFLLPQSVALSIPLLTSTDDSKEEKTQKASDSSKWTMVSSTSSSSCQSFPCMASVPKHENYVSVVQRN